MAFDFPASPSNGQTFTPPGGPMYVYNGSAWAGAGFTPVVTVLPTAESRNRIVNGAMQISQELAKGTTVNTSNAYVLDQWRCGFSLTTAPNYACIAATAADPADFLRAGTNANGALAAGQFSQLYTPLEGNKSADFRWGTASALPIVVQFTARSQIVGTATLAVGNSAANMTYLADFTFTQANVWQTFTIAIPGATAGSWNIDTAQGIGLHWCIGAGTTYRGTNLQWQAGNVLATAATTNWNTASGQYFDITNVGLYFDPNSTGLAPPWQTPDGAQEMLACQRYWSMLPLCMGTSSVTNTVANALALLPARLRANPALAFKSATAVINDFSVANRDCSGSPTLLDSTYDSLFLTVTTTTAMTGLNRPMGFNSNKIILNSRM